MIDKRVMADIKKRMKERKNEFKDRIKKVTSQCWGSFGRKPIVPNIESQEAKEKHRKILDPINLKRPANKPMPKLKERRTHKTIYKASRPMKVMEV